MNDNLPPMPPCAPEFKPRWDTDPGGYNEDQMKAYARAAIDRQSVPAGWMLVPIEPSDEWIARLESQQTVELESVDADAIRQCIVELLAAAPHPQPVPHSQFGSPELGAMILARCVEKDRQPQPVQPTNCRHCGGPENVLCAGQCRPAKGEKQ